MRTRRRVLHFAFCKEHLNTTRRKRTLCSPCWWWSYKDCASVPARLKEHSFSCEITCIWAHRLMHPGEDRLISAAFHCSPAGLGSKPAIPLKITVLALKTTVFFNNWQISFPSPQCLFCLLATVSSKAILKLNKPRFVLLNVVDLWTSPPQITTCIVSVNDGIALSCSSVHWPSLLKKHYWMQCG